MQIVDPFFWIDEGQTVTTAAELLDWWHAYYSIEPWDAETRIFSTEDPRKSKGMVKPDDARSQLDMLFGGR